MRKSERLLMWLAVVAMFMTGLLLCLGAQAQTHCDTLEHDRPLLDEIIQQQDDQLAGREQAIALLKVRVSLTDTITSEVRKQANQTIVRLTQQRDTEHTARIKAETALQPIAEENERLKGKTVVGRLFRKVRDGLAGVGAVSIVVGIGLKLLL